MKRLQIMRANIIGMAIIGLGIIVLINFLSARHHKRFDLTGQGENSLAEQSLKLLDTLETPLQVIVFDKLGGPSWIAAEKLLTTYKYHSDKIEANFVDPDKKPAMAEKYGVQRYGTIFFEYKNRQEQTEQITEESFTNIILKLTRTEQKKVYFLAGHGENDIFSGEKVGYSLLREAISKQNYAIQNLLIIRETKIPSDCSVLIISGPEKDFSPEELTAIEQYIQNNGKVFFLLDPPPGVGLNDFLAKWGISVGNDMVIDKMSQLFGGDYFMPVITSYSKHPITLDFNLASFFPVTRSIKAQKTPGKDLIITTLASTSSESWAETDYRAKNYSYTEGKDLKGPVSIALAVEISAKQEESKTEQHSGHDHNHEHNHDNKNDSTKEKEAAQPGGRLVVVGDADFVNNTYLNLSGNRDLFLNMLNWLAKEEGLISIRPKNTESSSVNLTQYQVQGILYLTVVFIPMFFLGIGVLVWLKRRRT